jgi:hypothetical protein
MKNLIFRFSFRRIAILCGAAALTFGQAPAAISASAPTDRPAAAETLAHAGYILVMMKLPPQHLQSGGGYGEAYGDGAGKASRRNLARRIARLHRLDLVEDWAMPAVGLDCYVMAVPAGSTVDAAIREVSAEPGIAWAQPMQNFHGQAAADPLMPAQPAAARWRLADLHKVTTGRDVKVAVIDSMVDADHPDLKGQVSIQQNFVAGHGARPEEHGTGVAGIIAAREGNGQGIAGVAPDARLMALRACWQEEGAPKKGSGTVCDTLSLAKALDYALGHGAQVINLSLAGPDDPLLGRFLDLALSRGVVVVGAVDPDLPGGGFPARRPGVVAVSDAPDRGLGAVMAPGRDIPTTRTAGQWYFVNGSSYSAAHVSGLFALLKQLSPRIRNSSALAVIRPGGEIDVCATVVRAKRGCDCACPTSGPLAQQTLHP